MVHASQPRRERLDVLMVTELVTRGDSLRGGGTVLVGSSCGLGAHYAALSEPPACPSLPGNPRPFFFFFFLLRGLSLFLFSLIRIQLLSFSAVLPHNQVAHF